MYGNNMKQLRKEYGIGKKELATGIGTSHQNITRWENNETIPSIVFCAKIADFYGISIDELIGREVPKNYSKNSITYNNSTHNGNNYQK